MPIGILEHESLLVELYVMSRVLNYACVTIIEIDIVDNHTCGLFDFKLSL